MSFLYCTVCETDINQSSVGEYGSLQCCPLCGTVVDEEQVFTHDTSSKDFSGELANANGSRVYGNGFNPGQQSKLPTAVFTSAHRRIKKDVDHVCSQLKLSSDVIEQINYLILDRVCKVHPFKYAKGKHVLVAACVYIICRLNDIPVALRQIAQAARCNRFALGTLARMVCREFKIDLPPLTVEDILPVVCSHLENSKKCEELALQFYLHSSTAMASTATPLIQSMAIAAIVNSAVNKKAAMTQKEFVQLICEKMSVVSSVSPVNCIRDLKKYMFKTLKEIPWIDMKYVKMSNIHFYIKDITRFRKNIGGLASESEGPLWYLKKQKIFAERNQRIKNAQRRIQLRKMRFEMKGKVEEDEEKDKGELDNEDEIIEELLEKGCTPEDIQEGYYECLRTTLSTSIDILDNEIDSYVRTPEEIEKLEKLADRDGNENVKKRKTKRLQRL